MTDERFNELLGGPLSHQLFPLTITRLATALRHVVETTGAAGELALEEYCRDRVERDYNVDGDLPEVCC